VIVSHLFSAPPLGYCPPSLTHLPAVTCLVLEEYTSGSYI